MKVSQEIKDYQKTVAVMGGKARWAKLTKEEKTALSKKMLAAKKTKKPSEE